MPTLRMDIKDAEKSHLTPARIHIRDENGKFYYPENGIRYENDGHFTVDGSFTINLPTGKISILVEKGKEYRSISADITLKKKEDHHIECELYRWINMAERGWYSGDLHIHRTINELRNIILAEDLNIAPNITVWNNWKYSSDDIRYMPENNILDIDKNHIMSLLTQEDERKGGAVLMFNLDSPIDLGLTSDWYPPGFSYCLSAHNKGSIVDQEKPFWWEAPVNVALGGVDTIGILNNHFQREGIMDNEAWGKPRDTSVYPGYRGFIENVLQQYYHYLNLGIRLPISAGSASGVLKNPVGYNRIYVHLGHNFSYEKWFLGMKAGLSFVTNGPMLFFSINHCELSSTLSADTGKQFNGIVYLNAISQNKLDKVELVFNGEVIYDFSAGEKSDLSKEFDISFSESGWVIARAFEVKDKTIRFAHTNPIYIRVGEPMKPRRESALYYVNWCKELLANSESDKNRYLTNKHREEVESLYLRALKYYEDMLSISQ